MLIVYKKDGFLHQQARQVIKYIQDGGTDYGGVHCERKSLTQNTTHNARVSAIRP